MQTAQLKSHEVFQFLRPEQVNAISSAAEELSYTAGDVVFKRGEPADGFFVVLEGQVALRLPRPDGVNLLIDEVTEGGIFGSCVCFQIHTYTLSATCSTDARILKIEASTLKKLMDDDPLMGYAIQTLVSRVYFKRYIETMQKLQAIVQSIPLEAA
jgi:CRP-like cAMP-binding protein